MLSILSLLSLYPSGCGHRGHWLHLCCSKKVHVTFWKWHQYIVSALWSCVDLCMPLDHPCWLLWTCCWFQLNEAEVKQLEMSNEPTKVMEVCATCGALLVVGDPHQRLDEHVSGKQHKGYAQIRMYLDQRRLADSEQALQVEQASWLADSQWLSSCHWMFCLWEKKFNYEWKF